MEQSRENGLGNRNDPYPNTIKEELNIVLTFLGFLFVFLPIMIGFAPDDAVYSIIKTEIFPSLELPMPLDYYLASHLFLAFFFLSVAFLVILDLYITNRSYDPSEIETQKIISGAFYRFLYLQGMYFYILLVIPFLAIFLHVFDILNYFRDIGILYVTVLIYGHLILKVIFLGNLFPIKMKNEEGKKLLAPNNLLTITGYLALYSAWLRLPFDRYLTDSLFLPAISRFGSLYLYLFFIVFVDLIVTKYVKFDMDAAFKEWLKKQKKPPTEEV